MSFSNDRYYEMKIPCLDDAGDYDNFGQIETVPEDEVRIFLEPYFKTTHFVIKIYNAVDN